MISNILAQDLLFLTAGVIALSSFINGLKTGQASNFVPGGFKRSEQPFLYWMAMAMSGAVFMVSLYILVAYSSKLL